MPGSLDLSETVARRKPTGSQSLISSSNENVGMLMMLTQQDSIASGPEKERSPRRSEINFDDEAADNLLETFEAPTLAARERASTFRNVQGDDKG